MLTSPPLGAPLMNANPSATGHRHRRTGFMLGLSAYAFWGVLPIYFKLIAAVPPFDIVAHRVLWSLPLLTLLILLSRSWPKVREAIALPGTMGILIATALLIGGNWLLYVYAVTSGHILASSFGYYLNPLANVLLGRFVLKERLSQLQWIAVAIAAAGISVLAAGALSQLWISLTLCATFALYGLLKKVVPADAITGLAIETAILFPVAILWITWRHSIGVPVMGSTATQTGLLLLAGVVSTTPLLLFTAAARRLPYSTLGMLQFIAPTLQFLIGVAYGEPLRAAHLIAFPAIWLALAIYVTALVRAPRLPQPPE
jgi:chloramphenicol-sensitive protein RarD